MVASQPGSGVKGWGNWGNALVVLILAVGAGLISWVQTSTHLNDVTIAVEHRLDVLERDVSFGRAELLEAQKGIETLRSTDTFIRESLERIENKVDMVYENTNDLAERVARIEALTR